MSGLSSLGGSPQGVFDPLCASGVDGVQFAGQFPQVVNGVAVDGDGVGRNCHREVLGGFGVTCPNVGARQACPDQAWSRRYSAGRVAKPRSRNRTARGPSPGASSAIPRCMSNQPSS